MVLAIVVRQVSWVELHVGPSASATALANSSPADWVRRPMIRRPLANCLNGTRPQSECFVETVMADYCWPSPLIFVPINPWFQSYHYQSVISPWFHVLMLSGRRYGDDR